MKMASLKHKSSVHCATVIKQEPVEADPLASPKQEMEYVSVKEETPECSEDFLGPSTHSIVEEEEEEEDDDDDEKDEDAVCEDDFEELKHEVESSGSEPESAIPVGVEDDKTDSDGRSLTACIPPASGTDNRIQCTNSQEAFNGNKIGIRHLGHRCCICKTTFAQLQELKEHTHLNRCELQHSCSVCHKIFTNSTDLKGHFRVHTGAHQYSCGVCNKTFAQRCTLKQHSRLHTGERPYNCKFCSKTFIRNTGLKQHLRVHTGERPYNCGVCNKTFTQSYTLTQHLRLHTGERPYSCRVCKKTFTRSSTLKEHSLLHTLANIPTDVASFISKNSLKKHSRLHTGRTSEVLVTRHLDEVGN
ncbi:zinc finger and SCAN domain-containing protein 31-like isoform X4 [Schistocerca piceifrons]|uniref:zinc finger and SCAN domain-containing protein 31-like isoform X4 n=1 Tax=Schistocerca piceifrons TaxID=274613 RepID=UPI001F5F67CD|nr:zinc finger and SCAN domain-containing protein 31-like isoform X4 [Schistocerca piceifrons]